MISFQVMMNTTVNEQAHKVALQNYSSSGYSDAVYEVFIMI